MLTLSSMGLFEPFPSESWTVSDRFQLNYGDCALLAAVTVVTVIVVTPCHRVCIMARDALLAAVRRFLTLDSICRILASVARSSGLSPASVKA